MKQHKLLDVRRWKAGLSYRDLADATGRAVSTVYDVLQGKRTSEPLLRAIADVLDKQEAK